MISQQHGGLVYYSHITPFNLARVKFFEIFARGRKLFLFGGVIFQIGLLTKMLSFQIVLSLFYVFVLFFFCDVD